VLRLVGVTATTLVALLAGWLAVLGVGFAQHGVFALGTLTGPIPALTLEFGVSPLAAPFCAILAVLGIAVAIWSTQRGEACDALLISAFTAAMLLVLIARSVAVFFVAWEVMSLISVFLVVSHHERRAVRRAALVYLIVAQTGALCVLAALAVLAFHAGGSSFLAIQNAASRLSPDTRNLVFILALLGFGSKAGLLPLHFWLPRAHPVAPAGASALLSGAMLKVSLFGLILVAFELAGPGPISWGIVTILIGVLSSVAGVLYALVEHDLKRLLAYHSVENVGIIVIGIGVALVGNATGNAPLAALGLIAALFHAINHGIFKALLFLGAGVVSDSEGTVDLERLGGLWARLAWTAPLFLIGCAAISAMPPFNGFVSEWLTFQGLVAGISGGDAATKIVLLTAIAGLALTGGLAAACFVKVFGIVFLGAARRRTAQPFVQERFGGSTLAMGLLAGLCILLGVVPMLAIGPLARVAGTLLGMPPIPTPSLPVLPATLAILPLFGALFAILVARRRGVRAVSTWTCGSPVTPSAQYTATAFSKPLRTIFGFVLFPERRRQYESGARWFPQKIFYFTESRYLIDEVSRRFAAVTLQVARRSRAMQSGSLRLYFAYALAALLLAVVMAR
jgi:hydrogenase-4 component B